LSPTLSSISGGPLNLVSSPAREVQSWHKPGDSLFMSGPDWETESVLDYPGDWFLSYAVSYKHAGDALVQKMEANEVSLDAVGFAVCFLYRHYVELMLKGLIDSGTLLDSRQHYFPRHQRIDELWRLCRPLLERAAHESKHPEIDAVERCIRELALIDPSGAGFHYGEHKIGLPALPPVTQASLTNMRDVTNRLAGFLEGIHAWLDELAHHEADIEADIGGEA